MDTNKGSDPSVDTKRGKRKELRPVRVQTRLQESGAGLFKRVREAEGLSESDALRAAIKDWTLKHRGGIS